MDRTVCGNIERKNKKLYRSVCLTKDRQRNSKDVGGGGGPVQKCIIKLAIQAYSFSKQIFLLKSEGFSLAL